MHFFKKTVSAFLAFALLLSAAAFSVSARDIPNVTFTVDKLTATEGDTVTVVLGHKDMSVITFTGGIRFDKSKLTPTAITGVGQNKVKLFDSDGEAYLPTCLSSLEEAKTAGTVGFGFVNVEENTYPAADLVKITFTVNKGARGALVFTSFESTDGTNKYCEYGSQNIESVVVTLTAPATEETGKTNIAPLGTALCDSVSASYPEYVASNLNDVDNSTRWQSDSKGNDGETAWFGIALDKTYTLKKLVLDWETSHPSATGFYIEISTDGTSWTRTPFESERTVSEADADDHQVDTVTLTDSPRARFVRVVCTTAYRSTDGHTKDYPSCYEMEVYSTVAETDLTEEKCGDVNGDGSVDASDLTLLARHVGGIQTITDSTGLKNADTDGNGSVDASDLTKLARFVGGIISEM